MTERRMKSAGGLFPLLLLAFLPACSGPGAAEVERFGSGRGRAASAGADRIALTFFDPGMGDAYLVEFPGGRTLLVDAGIGWRVEAILSYLKARGIRRLDGLLLTHPHLDHYGGMARIVEEIPVTTFYSNGIPARSLAFARLEKTLRARSVGRRVLRRGDTLEELSGPRASLEVLYPDVPALESRGNRNRTTLVLLLTHHSLRFLLTGDAERTEENRLLSLEGGKLACDFLKLGHHGSPGSGSEDYLRAVNPRLAIAQGTAFPDVPLFYPRPNYRIRRVLGDCRSLVLTTRREGLIEVRSDGRDLRVRTLRREIDLCAPSPLQERQEEAVGAGRERIQPEKGAGAACGGREVGLRPARGDRFEVGGLFQERADHLAVLLVEEGAGGVGQPAPRPHPAREAAEDLEL
jgi:competence protein ComEC